MGMVNWVVTEWKISQDGGWLVQPFIVVEGQLPFTAKSPREYITELERMKYDTTLMRGPLNTLIGQFKDALEQAWKDKEPVKPT